MNELAGKHILVIGANGAFGQEFCKQLISQGAYVTGTARNAESAARLPSDLGRRLLVDLADNQSVVTLTNFLNHSPDPIDGVVLASGLVAFGSISETPANVKETLMKVNMLSPTNLVTDLLPKLQVSASENKLPFVLSISGVIAETPMAGLSAYSASKTALLGFAQAAKREFAKLGIDWIDARPGHTESGLAGRAIFGTAPNFGQGMRVSEVVSRMVDAIINQEKDLPSSAF